MARKLLTVHFTSAGVPQIGLTPTIDIFELNPTNPASNTHVVVGEPAVEIGLGWYRYDFTTYSPAKSYVFTFDGGNTLADCDRYQIGGNESYVEEIASSVWDQTLTDHQTTGSSGLALSQVQADVAEVRLNDAAMTTLLETMLKYQRNRTKIDVNNAQLIIYDDDCVTPLTTFNLRDFSGMPSVQEVCERVPTTC
jgi:hypothetical protein